MNEIDDEWLSRKRYSSENSKNTHTSEVNVDDQNDISFLRKDKLLAFGRRVACALFSLCHGNFATQRSILVGHKI